MGLQLKWLWVLIETVIEKNILYCLMCGRLEDHRSGLTKNKYFWIVREMRIVGGSLRTYCMSNF